MTENGTLLRVDDLAVEFNTDEGVVHAVNGVSYELNPGESLGIVGESGCGKSVSSLAIMGLVARPAGKVSRGSIEYRGQNLLDVDGDSMRGIRGKQIAMIFQDPMSSLNPVFPVGRQIEESVRLHLGMDKDQARAKAVELLDTVGIPAPEERVKDYPHQLSGGMQQRAMIAMAISCQPDILIADEPTTALDVTIQAQVIELLAELRRELGMAVILITHELALVAGFCDRVAVMYAGFIVEYAPVHELFARPQHPYTLGLMKAVPTITGDRSEKLSNIPGSPPDLIGLPQGCPYAPRCPYVRDACRAMVPALEDRGAGHPVRCIVDPTTGELR